MSLGAYLLSWQRNSGLLYFFKPSHEQVGDINQILLTHLQAKQAHLRLNKHGSCSHGGPRMDMLQFVVPSCVLVGPNLDAAIQIQPHECYMEGVFWGSGVLGLCLSVCSPPGETSITLQLVGSTL